jgi:MoxR-like ATPase
MTVTSFHRYRGDGSVPPGCAPVVRAGQRGRYLADPRLVRAVNTALAVEMPLLVTGEPGCGKTELAWSVASELGLGEVLAFHTRSDHQARDVLYAFDHLRRLFDVQAGERAAIEDLERYVSYRPLGEAIKGGRQRVVLIDEIDKAPRDFPNDLLDEIDQMAFSVAETGRRFPQSGQAVRPVVIITSNSERQLPEAFLRRCVFHRIDEPTGERLRQILRERVPDERLGEDLMEAAIGRFRQLREMKKDGHGLDKAPATAELIAWVKVLLRAGVPAAQVQKEPDLLELPGIGTLIKTQDDLDKVGGRRR